YTIKVCEDTFKNYDMYQFLDFYLMINTYKWFQF
ncbi:MAG: hypothetical protein ACI9Y7_001277, partial [Dokdonia sp.]